MVDDDINYRDGKSNLTRGTNSTLRLWSGIYNPEWRLIGKGEVVKLPQLSRLREEYIRESPQGSQAPNNLL